MTKKHFIATANIIAKMDSKEGKRIMAEHWAKEFAKENPHFDKARFFKACGWYGQAIFGDYLGKI